MRLSSSNKIVAKKVVPVSNRSPSPDLSTKHLLRQTEPIDFTLADKKRKQKQVEMRAQNKQIAVTNPRRDIKSRILTVNSYEIQDQIREKEFINNSDNTKSKKKLSMTVTDRNVVSRQSIDRRSITPTQNNDPATVAELQLKLQSLSKQNKSLRQHMFSQTGGSPSQPNELEVSRIKHELMRNMQEEMHRVESNLNDRMMELKQQSKRLQQEFIRESKSKRGSKVVDFADTINPKASDIIEQEHTIRRINNSLLTPMQSQARSNPTVANTPLLDVNVSSEKLIELQRQNEDLTKQNFQYKSAYDKLIRDQQESHVNVTEFNANSFMKQSNRLRSSEVELQRLLEQNNELKIKNMSLEKSFIDMKRLNNVKVTESINQLTPNEKGLSQIIREREDEIVRLQKVIRSQQTPLNLNHEHAQYRINELSQENYRLKQQIAALEINMTKENLSVSRVDADFQEKRIVDLENRNGELERALLSVRNEDADYMDKIVEIKEIEIHRLKEEINSLREQYTNNNRLENEMGEIRQTLYEANQKIQQGEKVNYLNKQQLEAELSYLDQIRFRAGNIQYPQGDGVFREITIKYKELLNEKIELTKQLNNKIYEISRLNAENDKSKLAMIELNIEYSNEKHSRQRAESMVEEQGKQLESVRLEIEKLKGVIERTQREKSMVRSRVVSQWEDQVGRARN